MNNNATPLSKQDAAELYKLMAGQEADTANYAPLAERADLTPRFSPELLRRVDAAMLGTAPLHRGLPIGVLIALYAFTICCIPGLVISAAHLRTPAAEAETEYETLSPAAPAAESEPAPQPADETAQESTEEAQQTAAAKAAPAHKPILSKGTLARRLQKKAQEARAKKASAAPAKKAAKSNKKSTKSTAKSGKSTAKSSKSAAKSGKSDKSGKKSKSKAKKKASRSGGKSRKSTSRSNDQAEQEQLYSFPPYRVFPQRFRRVRVPSYYMYY